MLDRFFRICERVYQYQLNRLSKNRQKLIDPGSKSDYTSSILWRFLIGRLSNMAAKKRAETIRYEENPFIEGMVVPIKGQKVQLSRLGRDDNVLVNQATGEVQGTHITTFKRVDSEQFVKLFTANIALTFELGAAGIKAFGVLVWILQEKTISKDLVPLDKFVLGDFLKAQEKPCPSRRRRLLEVWPSWRRRKSSPSMFGRVGTSSTPTSCSTATA